MNIFGQAATYVRELLQESRADLALRIRLQLKDAFFAANLDNGRDRRRGAGNCSSLGRTCPATDHRCQQRCDIEPVLQAGNSAAQPVVVGLHLCQQRGIDEVVLAESTFLVDYRNRWR